MRVTVAICTWNRADLLDQTLQQMRRLRIPAAVAWEVLVVNNNCSDHTHDVVLRHRDGLPLREIAEPRPGKSYALNTAIAHIHSDLILWTDDDVLVDPGWLESYVQAADRHSAVALFGGPIVPWFERQLPPWLAEAWPRVSDAYAVREDPLCVGPITPQLLPYGANFAVRTALQRSYPYNPRLGRVGQGQRRGEETDVILRMLADGHLGLWCPEARVQHFIPANRLTEAYLRGFFYGIGQTHAVTDADPQPRAPEAWTRLHRLGKAAFAELRFRVTRRVCPPQRWVKDLTRCGYYWGRAA